LVLGFQLNFPFLNVNRTLFLCVVNTDMGLDILLGLVGKTTFPWLISNVIDQETGLPLGNGKMKHIIERNGMKIGFVLSFFRIINTYKLTNWNYLNQPCFPFLLDGPCRV